MAKEIVNLPSGRQGVASSDPKMTDEHKEMVDEFNEAMEKHIEMRKSRKKLTYIGIAFAVLVILVFMVYLLLR